MVPLAFCFVAGRGRVVLLQDKSIHLWHNSRETRRDGGRPHGRHDWNACRMGCGHSAGRCVVVRRGGTASRADRRAQRERDGDSRRDRGEPRGAPGGRSARSGTPQWVFAGSAARRANPGQGQSRYCGCHADDGWIHCARGAPGQGGRRGGAQASPGGRRDRRQGEPHRVGELPERSHAERLLLARSRGCPSIRSRT